MPAPLRKIVSSLQASSAHGSDDHYTIASGYYTYRSDKAPHEVLNVLEGYGYRVVAAITIMKQTAVWTLHKQE